VRTPATRDQIETPRLRSRPFVPDDAEAAFGWLGDPDVMRFIPTGPDGSVMDTRQRIAAYIEHQSVHGFSKWIICERGSQKPIGDSGLIIFPDSGKIDLGFRFSKPCWASGFATEIASAWIHAAFVDFQLDRLTAFAHPQNAASLRVLEKVGFRATGQEQVMGMDAITFFLDAAAP
jgi:RimJ/RimL family protein N-acetyltransferase